jgi:hypothetical protein
VGRTKLITSASAFWLFFSGQCFEFIDGLCFCVLESNSLSLSILLVGIFYVIVFCVAESSEPEDGSSSLCRPDHKGKAARGGTAFSNLTNSPVRKPLPTTKVGLPFSHSLPPINIYSWRGMYNQISASSIT